MTAIGFVLTVLGFILAVITYQEDSRPAQLIRAIGGFSTIGGGLLFFAGVVIKLWEVMP